MSGGNPKKNGKISTMKTRSSYNILNDELADSAAAPAGLEINSEPANNKDSLPPTSGMELAGYLKEATSNFQKILDNAVKSLIDSVKKVERALEFEGLRINELEKKNVELESRLEKMEKAYEHLAQRVGSHDSEVNKKERLSRRNNFRIVGVNEPKDGKTEDCAKFVEDILKTKFKMDIKVERADRAGKRGDKPRDKPRHIIVKTNLYDEKVAIMKNARDALKDDPFYFVNDLTKQDLEQKKKHKKEVQDLYAKGTKLRFYAGQWRGNGGVPYFTA